MNRMRIYRMAYKKRQQVRDAVAEMLGPMPHRIEAIQPGEPTLVRIYASERVHALLGEVYPVHELVTASNGGVR